MSGLRDSPSYGILERIKLYFCHSSAKIYASIENCLLCPSVISDKQCRKLHNHSTKSVVKVLENLAGGIATFPIFPSESLPL